MDTPFKIALLSAGALFALTACNNNPGTPDWSVDTADTGSVQDTANANPLIEQVSFTCDFGNPDTWSFQSQADGWAGLAVLDIFETGDGYWPSEPNKVWSETHDMQNTGYDPNGTWDEWDLSLKSVTAIDQQIAGQTTLFSCTWNDGGSLAFRETIYDQSSKKLDCVIWGHQSSQYFNGYLGDSCVCIDSDGSCTN